MATDDPSATPAAPSAPKPGMGTGTKLLVIFGGVAGLGLLMCCGGFAYLGYKAKDFVTTDPVKIRERTASIADIEIPDKLEPKFATNMVVMQMVGYTAKGAEDRGMLFLIEIPKSSVSGQEDAREQMQSQLEQQHARRGGTRRPRGAKPTSRETHMISIRGEEVPFQFLEYESDGGKVKTVEVTGLFESKGGFCMLQLDTDQDILSKEQIEAMLRTIK